MKKMASFSRVNISEGETKKCMTCMFSLSFSLVLFSDDHTKSTNLSHNALRPEILVGGPLFCAFSLIVLIVVKCNPFVSLY